MDAATLERISAEFSPRPWQQHVLDTIEGGDDVMVVVPTGSGKSFCYWMPALRRFVVDGTPSILLTPTIALMEDQVASDASRGLYSVALHSAQKDRETKAKIAEFLDGKAFIAYMAPERLDLFGATAREVGIAPRVYLVAVDEAHFCVSWSDFRPAYGRIHKLLQDAGVSPGVRLALSATIPGDSRDTVATVTGLAPGYRVIREDPFRWNLRYEVRPTSESWPEFLHLLSEAIAPKGATLVYTTSPKRADWFASDLRKRGHAAVAYHGQLRDSEKTRVVKAFRDKEIQVVVATAAFGMGIDRADIRRVIQTDIPESPEAYLQSSGRAGRDSKKSRCILIPCPNPERPGTYLDLRKWPEPPVLEKAYRALYEHARDQGAGVAITAMPMSMLAEVSKVGDSAMVSSAVRHLERVLGKSVFQRLPANTQKICITEILETKGASRRKPENQEFIEGLRKFVGVTVDVKALMTSFRCDFSTFWKRFRAVEKAVKWMKSDSDAGTTTRPIRFGKKAPRPEELDLTKYARPDENPKFEAMIAYAWMTSGCRQRFLLEKAGLVDMGENNCGVCDLCKSI